MRKAFRLAVLGLLTVQLSAYSAQIFSTNSVWRFRRGNSEASSPATIWRTTAFSDTVAFSNAPAPFWYGDVLPGGTQLIDMQNSYSCIFLRQTFVITNAQEVTGLKLGALVDDGFIAWINGTEVQRVNIAPGAPTYQTLSSNAPVEPVPFVIYDLPPSSGYLTNGTNMIAVQVFNTTLNSSDLGFDCSLTSVVVETNPPVISNVLPAPGTVSSLTSVTVTFSEPVTGIDADDFLLNGIPPDSISGSGGTYTFTFTQPLYGAVYITWAGGHGIVDLATPPNPFNASGAGATWQYNLVDSTPPVISNLHPPAGLTVQILSQIEVTFSEDVLGVQASDLLVGGQPATNVTQVPGGPFIFRFPPRPAGPVVMTWAAGHGITDAAASPNPFAGGSWTNTVDPNAPNYDLVINEFLAANVSTNGLMDEDGEQQDWIEIHNRGTVPVNLANWALSDDAELPSLWTFPARTLNPNSYLVVFASGKDRRSTNSASPLHTNFKLGDGEHLGLYTPDSPRLLASGFTPYPDQRNDVSYGFDANGNLRYFTTPSPGLPNGISTVAGVCEPVHANVKRGHFTTPFDLTVSSATPGAVLRYTIDGSEPTGVSPIFPSSLRITNTTLFRAAAFRTNYLPSKAITDSYFFNLPANLRSLPVLSIVTASNNLYGSSGILGINGGNYFSGPWQPNGPGDFHNPSQHGLAWERPTSVEWIRPEDDSGFQIDCGIRVQGSDYQRPRLTPASKFSFRLYFRGDYGPGRLDYPLLPLTSVHEFDQLVLRAGFNEQGNPFIRDEIHRRLSSDMGSIASHGNLAVVFINGVYYAGSPWYNPTERVHEEFFQQHLGGSEDWDVVSPAWAQGSGTPGVIDGDRADFQSLVSYINNQNVSVQSVYSNIARRLDLTNFVDYCLLNAYAAMGDWPGNNWRAGRDRSNSVWRFVVWDAEWGMGIYDRTVAINSFTQTGGGPFDSGLGSIGSSEIAQIYDRLRASPEFRLLWADRVQKHFFNGGALTGANITNRFEELRGELLQLMPVMETEILDWARDRQDIFFNQMAPYGLLASSNAPGFNQFGGRVPVGFGLVMTNLFGFIYYTTNGTDPRVPFSGAALASASIYTGPVVLNNTVTIRARTLQGANWSALTEVTFTVGSLGIPLRITEIMYNPPGGSLYEFIELQNAGGAAIDLSGMYFDGITFMFNEGTSLNGGGRIVLGANTDTNAWKSRYPGANPVGWFAGNLNNSGERISLFDRNGNLITTVDYQDAGGWPTAADGAGRSLEIINANGNPDDPANWQASGQTNGSPGSINSTASATPVVLNEIMAENLSAVNHGGTFPDWVELYNSSNGPVNITGWSLTDDGNARKFVFPSTTIPALSFLTVWCDSTTNITPGLHTGFSLDRDGEMVFLYDATTNRVDALSFGLQAANYSIGRISGNWTLTVPTTNAPNVAAALASSTNLAINEWLANPAPGLPDWIELFNNSASAPVSLKGLYLSNSNSLHQLSALAFLAPRGYLQLFADENVGPDHLDFKLPAASGSITLSDATGGEIQKITYGTQVESVSQGRMPDGTAAITTFPGSVSPETTNYTVIYSGPVLNEILARNKSVNVGTQVVDFVEIYNPGVSTFNLGGMSVSVDSPEPGQWVFPASTFLGPNSYMLLRCNGDQPPSMIGGNYNLGRSLDGESSSVYLFNTNGQLMNSIEYGFQVEDLSIGLTGGQWRLLGSPTPGTGNDFAAILGSNTALRVNEWMADSEDDEDWFEIFNSTNRPVNLSTVSISDDPSFAGQNMFRPASLSFVGANGYVKWIADANAGQGHNHVNFGLDAQGDSTVLYAVSGQNFTLVDSVGFGAQSPGISEGSLPDGVDPVVSFPGSPTPGESNYRLLQSVVVNEALTHTDPPLEDAIEFRNPTASPVNIGGWFLSNSRVDRRKYQIPGGTTIPAGGFVVVYEYQFNSGSSNAFTLNSAHGDEIWLSAATGGIETGDRATAQFGASFNGVSFGRIVTSAGVDFAPLMQRTFGMDNPATLAQFRTGIGLSNAGPVIGPIVINEILYHPPGGTNGNDEFIELLNNTGTTVVLYDPAYPTNHWKIGGGIDYTFPATVSLAPGDYLLVVDFDPLTNAVALSEFRTRYNVSTNVQIHGPFSGDLGNHDDSVELYRPDAPQLPPHPDAGFVPYVLADRVHYSDAQPWPTGAVDGGGLSLQRLAPTLYGNEPLHWFASAPSPGASNPSPDTDGDGIPDSAELLMGLDPGNPADGAADSDGDGLSNYGEYVAGTNHQDANSYLRFEKITVGIDVQLTFQAVANKGYSVLYKNSLSDAAWLKLADVAPQPVNQLQTVTNTFGAATRYYRLTTPIVQP